MIPTLSRSNMVRTEHAFFEPQLVGGLAWLLAVSLLAFAAFLVPVPPEVLALCCGVITLLLTLRLLASRLLIHVYAYLVVDWRRDALYLASIVVALALGVRAVLRIYAMPGCPAREIETAHMIPSLGTFHIADLAVALMVCGFVLMEPLCFRRSLAVQYMWPTSDASYWVRWGSRLACPLTALCLCLSLHHLAAGRLWDAHLRAREIMQAILDKPDKISASVSRHLDDPEVVDELVTLAMCQPNRDWARQLADIPMRRRATTAWRQMVEATREEEP